MCVKEQVHQVMRAGGRLAGGWAGDPGKSHLCSSSEKAAWR